MSAYSVAHEIAIESRFVETKGFAGQIALIKDDASGHAPATKIHIIQMLVRMVAEAEDGDDIFFHCKSFTIMT